MSMSRPSNTEAQHYFDFKKNQILDQYVSLAYSGSQWDVQLGVGFHSHTEGRIYYALFVQGVPADAV